MVRHRFPTVPGAEGTGLLKPVRIGNRPALQKHKGDIMSSSDPTVHCSLHINEHNQAVLRFGGHWARQLTFTSSQALRELGLSLVAAADAIDADQPSSGLPEWLQHNQRVERHGRTS